MANLPSEIGDLTQVECLYLSNNELIEIPSTFSKLINLEYLHLYSNCLTSLPNLDGLSLLSKEIRSVFYRMGYLLEKLKCIRNMSKDRSFHSNFHLEDENLTNLDRDVISRW